MKDDNFLRANNAQHLWHPMGHPGDLRAHAPPIIPRAEGPSIMATDGH